MKLVYKTVKLAAKLLRKKFYNKTKSHKLVPLPNYIAWDCTRRCNLRCEHCGATKEKYINELTAEEIEKVIEEISKTKNCYFGATGGEPFLRQDLLEVMTFAKSKGLRTGVASNGYLINNKKAEEIKKAKIDAIQISLDGLEKTHNKIRRNPRSFTQAIQAIKNLQRIPSLILSVATTLTKSNFKELEKLYNLLIDLKIKIWRIGVIMPIGRAKDSTNLKLKSGELIKLFDFIKKNNNRKMYIYMGENLPFLAGYEEAVRDEPALCPVGITACCVGVNGNVRGCPEQPDTAEFIEGNIKEQSIFDIWQNGFKKYRLQEILTRDIKCNNCKDKYSCYGGCWVMRTGNLNCIYNLIK